MIFCPNFSNKQVKQEFEELVQAVGEDMAYLLWDRNNGYALDKAPNGADSRKPFRRKEKCICSNLKTSLVIG